MRPADIRGSCCGSQETKKLTGNVMAAIKTMAVVDQANQLGRVLPPEAFYNELIRSVTTVPVLVLGTA